MKLFDDFLASGEHENEVIGSSALHLVEAAGTRRCRLW